MHIQDGHAQAAGGTDRARDGVRNVVELQIQKNVQASTDDLTNKARALSGKQLVSHFEGTDYSRQSLDQTERRGPVGYIKCDYYSLARQAHLSLGMNFRATEFMQYLRPVGCGPSSKT